MSGTVGVICNDNARYSLFAIRLTQLRSPPNTQLDWSVTSDRIVGRNTLARRALKRGAEWLLFLDDDHVFGEDLLHRLLAHEVPIAGALYLQRNVPFRPVAYSAKTREDHYEALDLTAHEQDDLVQVRALGTGGMLIRSEVFRAMEYPWFEHGTASEDLIFCDKATKLGISIYCDLAARIGHMTMAAVWPSWDEEAKWAVGFTVADSYRMKAPIAGPDDDDELELEDEDPAPS